MLVVFGCVCLLLWVDRLGFIAAVIAFVVLATGCFALLFLLFLCWLSLLVAFVGCCCGLLLLVVAIACCC